MLVNNFYLGLDIFKIIMLVNINSIFSMPRSALLDLPTSMIISVNSTSKLYAKNSRYVPNSFNQFNLCLII